MAKKTATSKKRNVTAQSRFNSTRFAYYVGAAIIVLGLATTPAIKKFSKEEE